MDLHLYPDVILLHIVYRGVDLEISLSPMFIAFTSAVETCLELVG